VNSIKIFLFLFFHICFLNHFQVSGQNPLNNIHDNLNISENRIWRATPFPCDEVKLSLSWIKQRELLNVNYLHQLDPERLLHNFRVNAGIHSDAKPLEGWESPQCGLRGHFVGHYLSAQKPTSFVLQVLIPSWANAQTKVLINGQPFKTKITPSSFVKIERIWNDGDTAELLFDFRFYLKSMPDNENVIAACYGPVLLAYETEKEIILKGNQESIQQNLVKNEHEF
jgi:DUF1680 family protein